MDLDNLGKLLKVLRAAFQPSEITVFTGPDEELLPCFFWMNYCL